MTVNFYNYTGDDRVANKTLVPTKNVTCSVYDGCTIISPVLRLAYDSTIANSNYFYISEWGRYYKVTNVEVNDAKQMYVSGNVDAIKSFWSEINDCVGTVSRSEMTGVGQIIDTQLPIDPSAESTKVVDTGQGFKPAYRFILTVK